jgi:predicted nucleic acid-binding protein
MSSEVCVDANLVAKWYLFENLKDEALAFLAEAERAKVTIVAPDVVLAEVGSTIRRAVHRGLMASEKGHSALGLLKRAQIRRFDVRDLFDDAWRIAETYRLATLYDAYYLALAEVRGCDLWTADERFINSVQSLPRVRNLADYTEGALES